MNAFYEPAKIIVRKFDNTRWHSNGAAGDTCFDTMADAEQYLENVKARQTPGQSALILPTHVADCGHRVQPAGGWPLAGAPMLGEAKDADGSTLCYQCADDRQREDMRTARVFYAYVSRDQRRITSWPGGVLGEVTRYRSGRRIDTAHGWYRNVSVRVKDVHGAEWAGRGSDQKDSITLRRIKMRSE